MSPRGQHPRGFTLVELLLYTSLLGILIGVVSLTAANVLAARVKGQTIAEVEQQGVQALQYMLQVARNAEAVTAPAPTATAASLTLDVLTVAQDPTVFDLSGGALRTTEGAGAAVNLTNSQVTASALTFSNLSNIGTPGSVRVEFTLTYVNPTGRNEYDYAKTFHATASLHAP